MLPERSSEADLDFIRLTERYGLGQRPRKPGRKCPGAGLVYLLLQLGGYSKLYKYNLDMASTPAPRREAVRRPKEKRRAVEPLMGAEEVLEEAAAAPKRQRTEVRADPLSARHGRQELRRKQAPYGF